MKLLRTETDKQAEQMVRIFHLSVLRTLIRRHSKVKVVQPNVQNIHHKERQSAAGGKVVRNVIRQSKRTKEHGENSMNEVQPIGCADGGGTWRQNQTDYPDEGPEGEVENNVHLHHATD